MCNCPGDMRGDIMHRCCLQSETYRLLKQACEQILEDAGSFDIHIGNARANMLRRALGLEEKIYGEFYQQLLKAGRALLG